MRKVFLHISAVSAAVLMCLACSEDKASVIPRGKMARIYAEMLVMDQWALSEGHLRSAADTSLIYEPIFQKYGYDTEDYRKSVEHYMKDPERFSRILRTSAEILDERIVELKELKKAFARQEEIARFVTDFNIGEFYPYLSDEPYVHYYDSLSVVADSGSVYRIVPIERADTIYDLLRMIVPADTVDADTLLLKDEKLEADSALEETPESVKLEPIDFKNNNPKDKVKGPRKFDGMTKLIKHSQLDSMKLK